MSSTSPPSQVFAIIRDFHPSLRFVPFSTPPSDFDSPWPTIAAGSTHRFYDAQVPSGKDECIN